MTVNPAVLGFAAVAKNLDDLVTVPAGYSVTVLTRLGDPIAAGVAAYTNDGTDTNFAQRVGDHGDALYWYGLAAAGARDDNSSSTRGLLVLNHENINVAVSAPQPGRPPSAAARAPRPRRVKEIEAHGVGVVEYRDGGNRQWSWVQNSAFNRRITPEHPDGVQRPGARQRLAQDRRRRRRHRRHRHDQQLRQRPHRLGHQPDLRGELGRLLPPQRRRRRARPARADRAAAATA